MAEKLAQKKRGRASSIDRTLRILELFSEARPRLGVTEIAQEIRATSSTTYRYLRSLRRADLVEQLHGTAYVLGPAIISLDRTVRQCDPLISAGRSIIADLARSVQGAATLVRLFDVRMLCVYRELGPPGIEIGYDRGEAVPLFFGASSKAYLAHADLRRLRKIYQRFSAEAHAAGLGADWATFRGRIRAFRDSRGIVTRGEVQPGNVGIAAPVFARDGTIHATLTLILRRRHCPKSLEEALISRVVEAAERIARRLP